jgi:hypothetical protein
MPLVLDLNGQNKYKDNIYPDGFSGPEWPSEDSQVLVAWFGYLSLSGVPRGPVVASVTS